MDLATFMRIVGCPDDTLRLQALGIDFNILSNLTNNDFDRLRIHHPVRGMIQHGLEMMRRGWLAGFGGVREFDVGYEQQGPHPHQLHPQPSHMDILSPQHQQSGLHNQSEQHVEPHTQGYAVGIESGDMQCPSSLWSIGDASNPAETGYHLEEKTVTGESKRRWSTTAHPAKW